MKHTTTISGPMIANGMRRIEAKSGMVASTSTTATTLPRYMRGDQAPDEVRPLDEQHRAGVQAPDHQAAHHHRRRGRAGNAQRQHRQHGAAAGRVVGGLRRDDALRLALAEARRVAREALGDAVAHEGGRGRPAGRNAHPAADEPLSAAARPSSAAVAPASRSTSRRPDAAPGRRRSAALPPWSASSSPMPNRPMTAMRKLMPRSSSLNPIGQAQAARDRVHADCREREAEHHRDDGLERGRAAEADEAGEGQEIDGEIFRRARTAARTARPSRTAA